MTNRLRLQCLGALLFCFSLFPYQIDAQVFTGKKTTYQSPVLHKTFTEFEVFKMDAEPLATLIRTGANEGQATIIFGDHQWNLSLTSSDLLSTTYFSTVQTTDGKTVSHKRPEIAFKGYESGGGKVRLTLDKDLIYGYIEQGGLLWRIEPLRYMEPGAAADMFVVYEKSATILDPNVSCGVTEEMEKMSHILQEEQDKTKNATPDFLAVYQLQIAVASDGLMVTKYGSPSAVEAHNIGVLNDVEGDYIGNFNHDLCFDIVTQFVSTAYPGPWTASTEAGELLASFRTWGNAGNFGATYDVGELWTNRDFNQGTVGIAYLNAICNNNNYHCLQDFTGNGNLLRCMTSHELGHNFSSIHDNCPAGGDYIMCPFVSNATAWSSQSTSSINAYMQSRINNGCLASCVVGPPLVAAFDWSPEPGCVGQPVQFTDQSTGNITTRKWTFAGGVPSTSTLQNPTATFSTPGPHNVTLVLTGPNNTSGTITQTVHIDPLPIANFTYFVDGLTVSFTNTSSNATTYLWEFGDGAESNETDPIYTYGVAGIYVVKLTATNHCGSATKTFTVNTAPEAGFSADPTTGCSPLVVQLINESSSNSTTYQWQFPGGLPTGSNQPNPVVLYNTPGTYTITLTATNNSGTSSVTRTNYITVIGGPAPGFSFTTSGLTATFTNTSINAVSYLWNFGDNTTSTLANPVHTYTLAGTYTVKLTATNSCGSVELTKTVVVTSPTTASFTSSANSGCGPLTVNFTNTSVGATTYSWEFPGGNPATSTQTNPTVVYNTPGTYTVTLTASNGSGGSTATSTITVNPLPTPTFTSTNNNAVVTFTNTSNNATSYSWNFGDNSTSTESNPTHTYATDGVYTVVLTATNACGTATSSQTVTVVTPPTAGFTASPATGCAPLTVQYNNTSSANATTFNWTFTGGNPATSTAANPTVVYNTPGTYTVTLQVSNSAGNNSVTQTNYITVNTTPVASFTSSTTGATSTFTNTSTNAVSYSWNFGDNGTSTQSNPTHTYATDGVYTVTLTATNACGNVTTTQTVTIVTPPTANFSAAQTSGCAPFSVQFNNTSSSNSATYSWSFPGGTPATSTAQNPTVVYNVAGLYTVELTVSNSAGNSNITKVDYISVGTTPSTGFTSSVTEDVATFTNSSTNANSYSWNFGDGGSSTQSNPTHTYENDGTYTVVLTATNTCGTSTFTQSVVIITAPEAGFTANTTSGCAPLSVQFSDLSSENTTGWSWTFPGGTPATSNVENPAVVYAAPGVYSVTLVASGPGGNSTFTQNNFITVGTVPFGGFTSSVSQNVTTFTNTSTNATSYLWAFGDGSTSIEASPTHTYTSDGVFEVTMSATNNCGTTIIEQTVTIVTAPIAAFTFNNSTGCSPLTVGFTNSSSSNAASYSWNFEGGSPASSTDPNPSATWSTPGVYTVTLTASNSAGSSTATATVTVNGAPAAGFTTQTAGLAVVATNTTLNATSYSWTFGDGGTSTDANPTHTYAATGTYTVTLVATNSCGSNTFVQQVTIAGSAPIAAFNSNLTGGCAGMTVQFTDESIGDPTGWSWSFPGGTPATSTEENPSVTYSTPGSYDVSLTVTNAFGNAVTALPQYITIVELPVAGFSFTASGASVAFTNASVGGSASSWTFGDGTTSNETNPTHVYTASGTYTVSLTTTNACGASTLEQTVVVVSVGINEVSWVDQFRLFPNPNPGRFTVEMSGKPERNVEFTLINNLGQIVHTEIVDFSSGSLTKLFDFAPLPSALYTLRVQADNSAMYVKIMVQK